MVLKLSIHDDLHGTREKGYMYENYICVVTLPPRGTFLPVKYGVYNNPTTRKFPLVAFYLIFSLILPLRLNSYYIAVPSRRSPLETPFAKVLAYLASDPQYRRIQLIRTNERYPSYVTGP